MVPVIVLYASLAAGQSTVAPAVLVDDGHQASPECLMARIRWHDTLGEQELRAAYQLCRENLTQSGGEFSDSLSLLAAAYATDLLVAGDEKAADQVLRDCIAWEPKMTCHEQLIDMLLRAGRDFEARSFARVLIERKKQRIEALSKALERGEIPDKYKAEMAAEEVVSLEQSLRYDRLAADGTIDGSALD